MEIILNFSTDSNVEDFLESISENNLTLLKERIKENVNSELEIASKNQITNFGSILNTILDSDEENKVFITASNNVKVNEDSVVITLLYVNKYENEEIYLQYI